MNDEAKLAEIAAKLTDLNTARAADLIRLEAKLQTILAAVQSMQEELRELSSGDSTTIAFS